MVATRDAIAWAAARVVDMHADPVMPDSGRPGRCAHCPPEGTGDRCRALHEAKLTLTSMDVPHPQH